MTTVRTRDEALQVLAVALAKWGSTSRGIWTQATARMGGILSEIESEVRQRAARVAAVEAALAASTDEERPALQAQLDQAHRSHDGARHAANEAAAARDALQSAFRRAMPTLESTLPAAHADLRRRLASLGGYRNVSGTSGSDKAAAIGDDGLEAGGYPVTGIKDVSLQDLDAGDNPITGRFGKGDTTQSDYRWATETWETVVRPGVRRGMTRHEFSERDAQRNAPPLRRTADVYDLFLGDTDAIVVARQPSGRFNVINGRHRVQVARELGIAHLPARVVT